MPSLAAKFVPGAGQVFDALKAIERGVTWLIDNQDKLAGMFEKLKLGIDFLIAKDAAGIKAALLAGVEQHGSALISLAASQLGLGKLPRLVKDALRLVPDTVEKAIRGTVRKLANALNVALNPVYKRRLHDLAPFVFGGRTLVIFAVRDGQGVNAVVYDQTGLIHRFVKNLEAKDFDTPAAKAHLADFLSKAKALADDAKGKPRGKQPAAATQNRMADLKAKQQALDVALNVIIEDVLSLSALGLLSSCFAAGTKLLTREGWKAVEDVAVGDELASRAEHDPGAPVVYERVEKTFVRTGAVLHLHLAGGGLVRTTPEHPFWVEGEGWVPAGGLLPGDRLATRVGWAVVEEAYDTGTYERVYNCRVATHHTYFVLPEGTEAAEAVWAHNTYEFVSARKVIKDLKAKLPSNKQPSAADERAILKGVSAFFEELNGYKDAPADRQRHKDTVGLMGFYADLEACLVEAINPRKPATPRYANVTAALEAYFNRVPIRALIAVESTKIEKFKLTKLPGPDMPPGNWATYIHTKTSGHQDATGRTYKQYSDDFAALSAQSNGQIAMPKLGDHGHHIVFKKAANNAGPKSKDNGRRESSAAKDVLLAYGINPYWDVANLAYAPNYSHPVAAAVEIRDRLAQAYDQGKSIEQIKTLLVDLAKAWISMDLRGMKK